MRITWGSTITAGITASIAVVIFMVAIPSILGMGMVDITKDLGVAFSTDSPHVAGAIFLAIMGIVWSALFAVFYNSLPGTYLTKGAIFGLIVGLFSLAVLPNIVGTLDSMVGAPNQYLVTQFAMNTQAIITLIAYVLFGLTLAWSHHPTDATGTV